MTQVQPTAKNSLIIAPSLLAADPLNLKEEIRSVESAGADWHHIDVMDGHFVPNLTFGPPLIKALKKQTNIPLDVHIMVSNPDQVASDYVHAGADLLTFHFEAATHSHRLVQQIKQMNAKAGIALNPGTPVSVIEPLLGDLDLILLMSVNPGFGGQSFIPYTYKRIEVLRKMLETIDVKDRPIISIDGGVGVKNIGQLHSAGCGAVVAGTSVYGSADRCEAIRQLRSM